MARSDEDDIDLRGWRSRGGDLCRRRFDRADAVCTVDLPVDRAYDEFADAMQPTGPSEVPFSRGPGGERGTLHLALDKVHDKSVTFHADLDNRPVFSLAVRLEPIKGGAATRILADGDIDASLIKEISGGEAPPQMLVAMTAKRATRAVLDKAADDLEHGRHLTRASWAGNSSFYSPHADGVAEPRTSQHGDLGSASAPMQPARSMIDPSAAARRNMARPV